MTSILVEVPLSAIAMAMGLGGLVGVVANRTATRWYLVLMSHDADEGTGGAPQPAGDLRFLLEGVVLGTSVTVPAISLIVFGVGLSFAAVTLFCVAVTLLAIAGGSATGCGRARPPCRPAYRSLRWRSRALGPGAMRTAREGEVDLHVYVVRLSGGLCLSGSGFHSSQPSAGTRMRPLIRTSFHGQPLRRIVSSFAFTMKDSDATGLYPQGRRVSSSRPSMADVV